MIAYIDVVDFLRQLPDVTFSRYPDGVGTWFYSMHPSYNSSNPQPDTGGLLVLNEIMTNNSVTLADEFGEFDSWVEILNPLPLDMDIADHYLSVDPNQPQLWNLPDGVIPADGFAIVWADGQIEQGADHASFILPVGGGDLVLVFGDHIIGAASYPALGFENSWSWQLGSPGSWIETAVPTPGLPNTTGVLVRNIVINEFVAKNNTGITDETGEYDDWVELFNAGSEAVFMGGMYLSDDPSEPLKWAIPNVSIAAGGYVLIWCDDDFEDGPMHASFKLSANGESILLYDETAQLMADLYDFGLQNADVSEGRRSDGGTPWVFFSEPTPGTTNNSVTAVSETPVLVSDDLYCYPNPFNPQVTISFAASKEGKVIVGIYDLRGRLINLLCDRTLEKGAHEVTWDGKDNAGQSLNSGVYLVRMVSVGGVVSRQITLLK